jgi:hypothetical protein
VHGLGAADLRGHVSMNPANYEVSGRVLLGLAPDRALYRL